MLDDCAQFDQMRRLQKCLQHTALLHQEVQVAGREVLGSRRPDQDSESDCNVLPDNEDVEFQRELLFERWLPVSVLLGFQRQFNAAQKYGLQPENLLHRISLLTAG